MFELKRRSFLKLLAATGAASALDPRPLPSQGGRPTESREGYHAARIVNEYSTFLPGGREALATPRRSPKPHPSACD